MSRENLLIEEVKKAGSRLDSASILRLILPALGDEVREVIGEYYRDEATIPGEKK